jgi:hypothetical protein
MLTPVRLLQLGQVLRLTSRLLTVAVAGQVLTNHLTNAGTEALAQLPRQLIELPLSSGYTRTPSTMATPVEHFVQHSKARVCSAHDARCGITISPEPASP